jgi:DNA-binding NtrC family response regulator
MVRLLLIDDDPQLRRTLAIVLADAGHAVSTAENGRDGLRALRDGAFDLVITDIIMPEMEGMETIRELRHRMPDLKIIAISGGWATSKSYLDMAEGLGAHYTLAKPFEAQELLDLIAKADSS